MTNRIFSALVASVDPPRRGTVRAVVHALVLVASITATPLRAEAPAISRLEESLAPNLLPMTFPQRSALGIRVARPEATPAVPRPPLPGRVSVPNEWSRIVATRVAGGVTSLQVATGDVVGVGQLLARIEGPEFAQLQRALLVARADFDLAERDEALERQLASEGIIASRRAVASATRLHQARVVLDERRHALALLGLNSEQIAEIEGSRAIQPTLEVGAPIGGVVLDQFAQAGEQLDAGAPIYRIGALDALQVDVHVPLDVAAQLEPGSPVLILEGDGAVGRISGIGGDVHARDQGVLVRVALEGTRLGLRPGQFVRVELGRSEPGAVFFAVPDTALTHLYGAAYVFREVEGGFEPVRVRLVGGSGQRVIVDGPLLSARPIVVAGTAALKAYWISEAGGH
jgi:cobalt-zinc-cadmium efflux system membrane fusion protein